jgi:hypothetical protein
VRHLQVPRAIRRVRRWQLRRGRPDRGRGRTGPRPCLPDATQDEPCCRYLRVLGGMQDEGPNLPVAHQVSRQALGHDDRLLARRGRRALLLAGPVCQRAGAGHGPAALLLLQLAARIGDAVLPGARHPARSDEHVPAREGRSRNADRARRSVRQLLSARDPASVAVPHGRHRSGAVPFHAGE